MPTSSHATQIPTAVDTHVANARKVVKRRKLELISSDSSSSVMPPTTSPHLLTPSSPNVAPNHGSTRYLDSNASSSTCSSCHRAVARAGSAPGGANVVSCSRCQLPTCVICSRKCEGLSSFSSPTSNPATRLAQLPAAHVGPTSYGSRRNMPMRRLPLRVNGATVNQTGAHLHTSIIPTATPPAFQRPTWANKHDLSSPSPDAMQVEDTDNKGEGCTYGVEAVLCKNCVKEDPSSGSTVCLGCSMNSTV